MRCYFTPACARLLSTCPSLCSLLFLPLRPGARARCLCTARPLHATASPLAVYNRARAVICAGAPLPARRKSTGSHRPAHATRTNNRARAVYYRARVVPNIPAARHVRPHCAGAGTYGHLTRACGVLNARVRVCWDGQPVDSQRACACTPTRACQRCCRAFRSHPKRPEHSLTRACPCA